MTDKMELIIWDVEHGACAMLWPETAGRAGALAMIDSGHNATERWYPGPYIRNVLGRDRLDYFINTNADQDHVSGLESLWQAGVTINTLTRNQSLSGPDLRRIKEAAGHRLTDDLERLVQLHTNYTATASVPFDDGMGGIRKRQFYNRYPALTDTNDLSLAAFISFGAFKILFPGDLGTEGWRLLLQNTEFRAELATTTILVAAHHGRQDGYYLPVFEHCGPRAVVLSDKAIVHDTQATVPLYRARVQPRSVYVSNTGANRHVLTTRRDGHIRFEVFPNGDFNIYTECG
jgi:beta-lactamase superfamily II metal-dependent hydrolase